jgi:hypothetical protein
MKPTNPTATGPRRAWALVAVLALAACGGGAVVALLPFVTPVGGAWSLDGDAATPQLDAVDDERFVITARAGTPYLQSDPIAVEGTYTSAAYRCAGNVVQPVIGDIDDRALVLYLDNGLRNTVCLSGRFTDLATFTAADGRVYRNLRVDVQLDKGVWESRDNARRRFKFTAPASVSNDQSEPVTGCELSSGPPYPALAGTMTGYVTATGAAPRIAELRRGDTVLLRNGVLVDGATLEFERPSGGSVKLRRLADTDPPARCN